MFRSVFLRIPVLALSLVPMGPRAEEADQAFSAPHVVDAPPGFNAACERYRWLCSSESVEALLFGDKALRRLVDTVNREVNREIVQATDREIYGVSERWTLPTAGRGDCEDLAMEKMRRLLNHGLSAERLSMAIVLGPRGDNHAVLLVRLDDGVLVLDSLTHRLKQLDDSGYHLLARQASDDRARWILADRFANEHASPRLRSGRRLQQEPSSLHATVGELGRR